MTLFLEQPLSQDMRIMNAVTASAVCLFVAGLGIVMIVRADKKKKALAAEADYE